uniref:Uncharacterized protein n=1 Tax=Aegilops tauschii subsp. strangulata TaxID=200361 RepID=A0A452YSG5_AEGTS
MYSREYTSLQIAPLNKLRTQVLFPTGYYNVAIEINIYTQLFAYPRRTS